MASDLVCTAYQYPTKRTLGLYGLSHQVKIFFTHRSKAVLLFGSFLLFMFRVCHAVMSVHWERAYLFALLYVTFSCFLSLPCGVLLDCGVVLDCIDS